MASSAAAGLKLEHVFIIHDCSVQMDLTYKSSCVAVIWH